MPRHPSLSTKKPPHGNVGVAVGQRYLTDRISIITRKLRVIRTCLGTYRYGPRKSHLGRVAQDRDHQQTSLSCMTASFHLNLHWRKRKPEQSNAKQKQFTIRAESEHNIRHNKIKISQANILQSAFHVVIPPTSGNSLSPSLVSSYWRLSLSRN